MLLLFGSAGSGKSLQGQILAARYGWTWISVGKVLRQRAVNDPEIQQMIDNGILLPAEITNKLVFERLDEEENLDNVIIDGYPRKLDQTEALIDYLEQRGNGWIDLVVVLDVGREEVMRRMAIRGRADDTPEAIATRLDIFATEGQKILDFLAEQDIRIEHIAGSRTVGQVHDHIDDLIRSLNIKLQ